MKSIFKILIIIVLLLIIRFSKEGFQNKVAYNMNSLVIKGAEGDIGPVGDKGPVGEQGDKGPEGIKGPVGPIGNRGPIGDIGPEGIVAIPKKLIILWYSNTFIPDGWVEACVCKCVIGMRTNAKRAVIFS